MSDRQTTQFVRLKVGDDWGHLYWAVEPVGPGGAADMKRGVQPRSGDMVMVRWPDDSESEAKVALEEYVREVSDHGNTYPVTGQKIRVCREVNGYPILIPIEHVDVDAEAVERWSKRRHENPVPFDSALTSGKAIGEFNEINPDAPSGSAETMGSPGLRAKVVEAAPVVGPRPLAAFPEPRRKVGGRSARFSSAQSEAYDYARRTTGEPDPAKDAQDALIDSVTSGDPFRVAGVSLLDLREALAQPMEDMRREFYLAKNAAAHHGAGYLSGRRLAGLLGPLAKAAGDCAGAAEAVQTS